MGPLLVPLPHVRKVQGSRRLMKRRTALLAPPSAGEWEGEARRGRSPFYCLFRRLVPLRNRTPEPWERRGMSDKLGNPFSPSHFTTRQGKMRESVDWR